MKYESDMPCFEKFDLAQFRERFMENKNDIEVTGGIWFLLIFQLMESVEKLIDISVENRRSSMYDNF